MRNRLPLLLSFVIFLGMSGMLNAKPENTTSKIKLNFGADLYSRYIWRGSQFGGNSPSIQPGISAAYKNLEIGAWGAYSIGGNNRSQELDLYAKYSFISIFNHESTS